MARSLAVLSAALAIGLSACGADVKVDAAQDVHAFFTAVQANDRAGFERHVDRAALRSNLKSQLGGAVAGEQGAMLGAILSGSAGDRMVDQMITPETFRIAWRQSGVSPDKAPSAAELAVVLKKLGDTRTCLPQGRGGDCVMTFEKQGEVWRLVEVRATGLQR
ncbi:MAG TPA: DUF2939 domain-containing protein [Caulobacteraceae bacterium]|nr:DUF2939 domain-containing protein [Caulobacteraceae bacterium]